jgi:hypothetical protein
MAPANPNWSTDAAGRKIWPLNNYLGVEFDEVTGDAEPRKSPPLRHG